MSIGRPSSYTDELADEICERLIEGETLVAICQSDHMPSRSAVLRWMHADPVFDARCARARQEQGDYMDDLVLKVADASTPETAQSDKVKISAYQWRAAKLAPKRYGDKQIVEQTSEVTVKQEHDFSKLDAGERQVMRMLLMKATPALPKPDKD